MDFTQDDKDCIARYKQDADFLHSMDTASILWCLNHGNPNVRKAGEYLAQMAERYRRGECNAWKDAQTVNDVLDLVTIAQLGGPTR
jgi:hypothetical protein